MRVVFEKSLGAMRVTGFEYQSKYSLKFELHHLEQWYKFRDGEVSDLRTLEIDVADKLAATTMQRFESMADEKQKILVELIEEDDLDLNIL